MRSFASTLALAALTCAACGPASVPGQALLQQGRYQEVIRTVRTNNQRAFWTRACAWWRLGKTHEARKELQVGLAQDRGSADGHRLLGSLEAHLGFPGAALHHLQRSLDLRPHQPVVRRAVAQLLLRRAYQRVGPGMGTFQQQLARQDVRQALSVAPSQKQQACSAAAHLDRGPSTAGATGCAGPPLATLVRVRTGSLGIGSSQRCGLPHAGRQLERLLRRHLLLSCQGAQTALRLEQHGCLEQAGAIWTALIDEAPADPRWYLMSARNLLARGELIRARHQLVNHVYLAPDRPAALLDTARIFLKLGHARQAGRRTVEAMALAGDGPRRREAERLLVRCRQESQSRLDGSSRGGKQEIKN